MSFFRAAFSGKKKKKNAIPKEQTKTNRSNAIATVAIDFGTTYSGWAFSFLTDYILDPRKISTKHWIGNNGLSLKAPTSILIQEDGKTIDSFGYEAEQKYARICEDGSQNNWFFFKRFKMSLHQEQGIRRDLLLTDYTGKQLPALTVFSLSIEFLKKDVLKEINDKTSTGIVMEDLRWVLTVPAIWNDAAKQFMREAATKAGIPNEALSICLEPEAASIYCCHLPVSKTSELGAEVISSLSQFAEGTQYIVLDAGGGTVDITVHEKTSHGNLKELYKATGGAWGGTKVDAEFEKFLIHIIGKDAMSTFRKHLEEYIELFSSFEVKKRSVLEITEDVTLRLPSRLSEVCKEERGTSLNDLVTESGYGENVTITSDKMRVNAKVIQEFFQPAIDSIIEYIRSLLKNKELKKCSAILMVGGFSASILLKERVKASFRNLKIIIPDEPELVVLKVQSSLAMSQDLSLKGFVNSLMEQKRPIIVANAAFTRKY